MINRKVWLLKVILSCFSRGKFFVILGLGEFLSFCRCFFIVLFCSVKLNLF